jgi:hypothetical protein
VEIDNVGEDKLGEFDAEPKGKTTEANQRKKH